MAESHQDWPSYHIGTHDHLHAIGVLITNWNQVETAYQAFIQLIFPQDTSGGIRAFQLLNNDQRVKLIRDELITKLDSKEGDIIDHFLKMANICNGNRNVFAHAEMHNYIDENKLRISKGTGKTDIGAQYLFKLKDLREMADATNATFMFGLLVWGYFQTKSTFIHLRQMGQDTSWMRLIPLPEKPSLPRSWDQIREIPKPPPLQPESSQA